MACHWVYLVIEQNAIHPNLDTPGVGKIVTAALSKTPGCNRVEDYTRTCIFTSEGVNGHVGDPHAFIEE